MNHFRWPKILAISLQALFSTHALAVLTPCEINPVTTKTQIYVTCEQGSTEVTLPLEEDPEIELDDTFHLVFKNTLFNVKRTIHVLSAEDSSEVMTIDVVAPKQVVIKGLQADVNWVLSGLSGNLLDKLTISTHGTLAVMDELEIQSQLSIKSNQLYLLQPFSIRNGHFRLEYQEGILPRIGASFKSQSENQYSVLESTSTVNTPSKRRAQLKTIKDQTTFNVSLADLMHGYREAFGQTLAHDYPTLTSKADDDEKRAYIQQYVLPKITDNVKKGIIGEAIYRTHIQRTLPDYQFSDPKIGLNSFDTVYIQRDESKATKPVRDLIISEVKYAAHGRPVIGVIKLDGKEWRQLSTPYIRFTLDKMLEHTDHTEALAKTILKNSALVRLEFAVFNPNNLTLTVYSIGNMESSLFD